MLSDSCDDASSPDVVEGNMFHVMYSENHYFQATSGKCEIWSIMTNHLIYPNPETDSFLIYSFDEKRNQSVK